MSETIPVSGTCHEQFAQVETAFRSNFAERGEIGARVSVIREGEVIVDLCGGHTSEARDQPWDSGTLPKLGSSPCFGVQKCLLHCFAIGA